MRLKFLLPILAAVAFSCAREAPRKIDGRYEQAWVLYLEKEIPALAWPNFPGFVGLASPDDTLLVINFRCKTESYFVEINSDTGTVRHIARVNNNARVVGGMKHRPAAAPIVWAATAEHPIPGYYDVSGHQVKYHTPLDTGQVGSRAIQSDEVEDQSIYRFRQSPTDHEAWELSRWSVTGDEKYWTVPVEVLKEWYALYPDLYGPVDFTLQAGPDGVWLVINLPDDDAGVVLMKFSSKKGELVYNTKTKGRFTNYNAVHVTQRYKDAWFVSNHDRITKFYASGKQAWVATLTLPKGREPYLIRTLPTYDGGAICWFTQDGSIYLSRISNAGNITWRHTHTEPRQLFGDQSSVHELPNGDLVVGSYQGVITRYALK